MAAFLNWFFFCGVVPGVFFLSIRSIRPQMPIATAFAQGVWGGVSGIIYQDEYRNYPVSDVWAEFCRRNKVGADESWLKVVQKYEREVLLKRRRVLV